MTPIAASLAVGRSNFGIGNPSGIAASDDRRQGSQVASPKVSDATANAIEQLPRQAIYLHLLLVHGGTDRRVPIDHAKRLRDAITAAQGQVEWLDYAEEGRGIGKPANQLDYRTRVEAFLARHTQAAR